MTLSVNELNNQIKALLETTFLHVSVKGEVSRITYHNSGHLYFTLKDEQSSISCVMFKGNLSRVKFRLEEGMAIVLHGSISVYSPRGSYQINATSMEPDGEGALALAYEQLKKKLAAKGYFEHKKPIPKHISHIALVTSATGAALQDMLRVASKRWPLLKITLLDTLVQGESAKADIAKNIAQADSLGVDVIIIGRGGGSIEDLWAFNEECVADAIYTCKTPLISAIGHEIDYVISDFVADLRAPTPSAAMEMILPDMHEVLMRLDEQRELMDSYIQRVFYHKLQKLQHLKERLKAHSFEAKIDIYKKQIELYRSRFAQKLEYLVTSKTSTQEKLLIELHFLGKKFFSKKETQLQNLQMLLSQNNPEKALHVNYAQVLKDGKKTSLKELEIADTFELQSPNTSIKAKVLEKKSL
ncbi:MAG TPA: exodeoxyribonuclease VII large subunit [Sulfurospirillum sp. UBA12182]|nr:MAG TPA: exodeoxyribonuclease VII large subunit [Sulfurospirillum sp. UBA12182]